MPELTPSNATLTVQTARQGVAAKVGHDLVIAVDRWSATLDPDGLKATIDPSSLSVREGLGGLKPLSDKDRADIQKNINEKILKTGQNREITFDSDPISGGAGTWTIDGRLTLVGVTIPTQIPLTVAVGESEVTVTSSVTVRQTAFGIKPYSGMMGALKVADEVEIRAEARIPKADWPF